MKRYVAWAAAPILVATCAVLWAVTRPTADRTPRPGASVVPSAGDARAKASPVRALESSRYRLSLASQVKVGGSLVADIQVAGKWRLTEIARDAGQTRYHGKLEDLDLRIGTTSDGDPKRKEQLATGLTGDHFFTLTRGGQLQAIRLSGKMPALAEQMLKALVAALQFRRGLAGQDTWSARERDTTGEYKADYRRLAADRFAKSKTEYTRLFATAPTALGLSLQRPTIERSAHLFTFSGERLTELTVDEELRSASVGAMPEIHAITQISLAHLESSSPGAFASLIALDAESREARLEEPATPEAIRNDTDQARIAGLTLPQALAAMNAAGPDDTKRKARAYTALAAILRQDPKAIDDALARIRRKDASAKLLVDALGDAGTEAAQKALTTLGQDTALDKELRRAALMSLSFVSEPTRETLYLGALGNSGHPEIVPEVVPFLDHAAPSVRAAAVYALRRVPGAVPEKHIARMMTGDADPVVRKRAVEAAGSRSPSWPLVAPLTALLQNEKDFKTRHAALSVAIRWAPLVPSLVQALAWTRDNDPDPTLKRMANGALVRLRQAS